jgi:NADH:ubiquinone oxidoreductase subunit 5 (subunit L)/multisubunit Na+/H+ antiporter MnhA subunit
LIFYLFNTVDIEDIEILLPHFTTTTITIFSYKFSAIEMIAFFLFLASAAKSAQLFLHPWLPDAMEGPTPVSALLHSATMVTAGVFLVLRSSVVFSHAPSVSLIVAGIGLITANISSLTGLLQYDIKRIIAFSTCSQLGFMMFAAGIGNYTFALFHLVNHAFFKALLFMSAGSVIHATGEQDIRKMGSLFNMLPITYMAMLIASLSLIGFPFLSGFYSKDFLLEATYNIFGSFSFVIYFISAIATSVSSFYSFRLIYYVFFGDMALSKKMLQSVKESSYFLYVPLMILTLLSIFSGYYLKDLMTIQTSLYSFIASPLSDIASDQDFFSDLFKILPSIFSLFGLFLVYVIYAKYKISIQKLYRSYLLFSYLSCKKFFADAFNSFYVFLPVASFSLHTTYKVIDQGFLEYVGATGLYRSLEAIYGKFVPIETTIFIYRSFLFIIMTSGILIILVLVKALTLILLLCISTCLIVPTRG